MASTKEQVWLEEYLTCWNATEAARRAGYKWPRRQGAEKKAKFADEIAARLEERVMSADEALDELSDLARMNLSEYIEKADGLYLLDLEALKAAGLGKHIKAVKNTRDGPVIEFYDRQRALEMIAKHHGLLTKADPGSSEEKPFRILISYED